MLHLSTIKACFPWLIFWLHFHFPHSISILSTHQIYIYIYIYIYRKSAGRFSRGTVLNTLKQSRINIMRGKNDATTYPDKPVSIERAIAFNFNCFQSSVVYQATVTRSDNNTSETYIGLTETDFKTRHRNHTASFRHAKHKNSIELSKHIWTLKTFLIIYRPDLSSLNKRNELVSSCRHRNKALLRNS